VYCLLALREAICAKLPHYWLLCPLLVFLLLKHAQLRDRMIYLLLGCRSDLLLSFAIIHVAATAQNCRYHR
jgi:hypothetical protein